MKSIVILCLLGDPMIPPTSEPSRAGGYNIDVKQWLNHLSDSSLDIIAITNLSSHYSAVHENISSSITLYRVKLREDSLKDGQSLVDQYSLVRNDIQTILNSINVEPLFFHSYYWYNGLLAKDFSSQYGVPFVHTVIDLAAYKLISGEVLSFKEQYDLEKEVFSKATYLFAITNTEKDTLIEHYPVQSERIIVVGREADEVFLHPDHDSYGQSGVSTISKKELEDRFLGSNHEVLERWWNIGAFMYYGRLVETKGIKHIVKAWYSLYLRYEGNIPPLWIVGGLPTTILTFRNTLDKDIPIDKLEYNQQLCWWGNVSQRSIRTLMMKSCAVIMHSQHESGGLVVLEALASGIPIIATSVGFANDIIADWHAGFRTDYADIDALANRMNHFIEQPLLSRCMGISASELYRYFQKNWHPFDRIDRVYKNLYEGRYDECFADIMACSGRNSLTQRRLNEIPPLDMQRDWIVQTMQVLLCNNDLINSLKFLEDKSSAADIWEVKTQRSTYIAKRIYSVLNLSRFIFQDDPPGFHSIDRFSDSLMSMKSKNVLQPVTYSRTYRIIILPLAKVIENTSVDILYDAVLLLKSFQKDMASLDRIEISPKTSVMPIKLIDELYREKSHSDCEFLDQYRGVLSTLQTHASTVKTQYGIMYGKSAIEHMVQLGNKRFLLPSADIRYGDQNIDYALTIIDYLLHTKGISKNDLSQIVMKCSELIGVSTKTLCTSLGLVIAMQSKKDYVLYGNTEDTRMNVIFDFILSML